MTNLFDYQPSYPEAPGYQRTDTSCAAAEAIKPSASYLQRKVLDCLRDHGPQTMEGVAALTGFGRHSVQPRLSELRAKGEVCDSGDRGTLASGRSGILWALTNHQPPN